MNARQLRFSRNICAKSGKIKITYFVFLLFGMFVCALTWWLFRPPVIAEIKICDLSSQNGIVTFYGPACRHPLYKDKAFLILSGASNIPEYLKVNVRIAEAIDPDLNSGNDDAILFEKGQMRNTNWLQARNMYSYLPICKPPKIEIGKKYNLHYDVSSDVEIESLSLWLFWFK